MLDDKDSKLGGIVIGDVREASVDPEAGQSVWLELRAYLSGSNPRLAASDVAVIFTAGEAQTRVLTDSHGKARFSYTADQPGAVAVTATLDIENNGEAPSHTFHLTALAAGVWDDAQIELAGSEPRSWGGHPLFPRVGQTFTIKLSVPNAQSALIDRAICLGLKGYSSARELGFTVTPALGVSRKLTADGLTWQGRGTIGGACEFQLEASRLLNHSPVHPISLGSMTPERHPENAIEVQVPG
ncbi:hypothetical protein [Pseudomonas sp. RT6P73]